MKKAFYTFLLSTALFGILLPGSTTEYLLTVEYDEKTDVIRRLDNPESLKRKCDLGVMYFHPWNKHFDETPTSEGYWKVKITNIEEQITERSVANKISISLISSFACIFLLTIFGVFDKKEASA